MPHRELAILDKMIEELRQELSNEILINGMLTEKVINISQRLDKYIFEYQSKKNPN